MPFLGNGAYGCVFKPHLKCETREDHPAGVGKVFHYAKDFEFEKRSLERVNEIDPEHRFTLPLLGTCKTAGIYKPSNAVSQCDTMNPNDQYLQLIMGYGGKSLDTILKKRISKVTYNKLFAAMGPVLDGIQTLVQHKLIHQDIKPGNLLFLKDKCFLIDFGIMETFKKVYKSPLLSSDYPYFPPEYKRISKTHRTPDIYIVDFLANFVHTFEIAGRNIALPHLFEDVLRIDLAHELKAFYDQPKHRYPDRIDMYQIGIIFLLIYVASNQNNAKHVDFIAHLVHPNPAKRYTPEQAIRHYKDLRTL